MSAEGPELAALTKRLADIPGDFLVEPRIGRRGVVDVAAVANDLSIRIGQPVGPGRLAGLAGTAPADRNRLQVALELCWLLGDPWFGNAPPEADALIGLLVDRATEAAAHVAARSFVTDPERREELVRTALDALGLRPRGESDEEARDRLSALDSAERARVLEAARAAEERARQVREALEAQRAEESADKWTRE